MSIPTSGTYTFSIAILQTWTGLGTSAGPRARYTLGSSNGNPVYYDVQATFDGTTISFTDSSGVNHSITYNSSYLAGQNNYKYDSVITQDSSNKDVTI